VSTSEIVRLAALKNVSRFKDHLRSLCVNIPCDNELAFDQHSPLRQVLIREQLTIGNRIAVQPMEGWDGMPDGTPSEHTFRRWQRFGRSGGKLIWGGEAVAVSQEGRANPNQLLAAEHTCAGLARLRTVLVEEHRHVTGSDEGLLIGLQLTHSGRFSHPNSHKRGEPRILYHHPILDRRLELPEDYPVLSDGDIRSIIEDFHHAAVLAWKSGFAFIDIKHCHGYLGHEFLSAHTREGKGIPEIPSNLIPYRWGFGLDPLNPVQEDFSEPLLFLSLLKKLNIRLVNLTAGSPYYNPHIQRPALFPPTDGYQPPEDPLVGVARQMEMTRVLKQRFPTLIFVGSAYSYLQNFLPHVAQAAVREGWVDLVGLGRMVLTYPELLWDATRGQPISPKRICRTFSDCTTAPRKGLPSGCYPLDDYYRESDFGLQLKLLKKN
jgi:NADPH2 dehydrogenase